MRSRSTFVESGAAHHYARCRAGWRGKHTGAGALQAQEGTRTDGRVTSPAVELSLSLHVTHVMSHVQLRILGKTP